MTNDDEIRLIHTGAIRLIAKEWTVELAVKTSAKALALSADAVHDQVAAKRKAADERVAGGKSVCECGHRGDGPNSQHAGTRVNDQMISNGHGHCLFCHCDEFTWARWTTDQPA